MSPHAMSSILNLIFSSPNPISSISRLMNIACMDEMPPKIVIEKYKSTRFWAVLVNEELLAVVCYKKGAMAIKEALLNAHGVGIVEKCSFQSQLRSAINSLPNISDNNEPASACLMCSSIRSCDTVKILFSYFNRLMPAFFLGRSFR